MEEHFLRVWEQGVDRWHGQAMSTEQIVRIREYHDQTPFYEVPTWVYGLRFAMLNKCYLTDTYLPWGYGLTGDCDLLCRHRRGRLPFFFMPGLWDRLEVRKRALSTWSISQ